MSQEPRAFPILYDDGSSYRGMLLRDYFAAKAMMGLLASDVRFADDYALVKRSYDIATKMVEAADHE